MATGKMTFTIETITPKKAAGYLENQVNKQRHRRPHRVEKYKGAMLRGEWKLNPQGIFFSPKGQLMNGQHRLDAIVASGCTVDMVVVRNVPEGIMAVIDNGAARSVADNLQMHKPTAELCTAITRLLVTTVDTTPLQVAKVASYFEKETHLLFSTCNTRRTGFCSAPILMGAIIQMHQTPSQAKQIAELYRNIVLQRFEVLPLVAGAFIRQVNAKTIKTDNALFARSLVTFFPPNKDLSRIRLSEEDVVRLVAEVREFYRGILCDE